MGLCFLASLPDWQMPGKSADKESRDGASHPGMADTAMVFKSVGILTDFPILLPQVPNLLMGPTGKSPPLMQSQQIWLAAWRISGDSGKQQGFQNKLQESWKNAKRPGTKSTYNSPWGKYVGWCVERQIDPFQSSV